MLTSAANAAHPLNLSNQLNQRSLKPKASPMAKKYSQSDWQSAEQHKTSRILL